MKLLKFVILALIMVPTAILGQSGDPLTGLFTTLTDIGNPSLPGRAGYSEPSQEYLLTGSGANIWFGEDSFSFLWKKMDGDFILEARMEFLGEGSHPHRKAGLMIRKGLDARAPHVSCVIHGDGLTSLQYRRTEGTDMEETSFEISGPGILRLEKKDNVFTMSVAASGEPFTSKSVEVDLGGGLKAGLFICSHDDSVSETARFANVRIFGTAPDTFVPYRDYIGSMLEELDLETGLRRILEVTPDNREAPNWTPDGSSLIYNSGGLLYRFDLHSGESSVLPTGFANRNNNDHVISFDGKRIAISNHVEGEGGGSAVFTLPLEGGEPKRVTANTPSYLHGWSPDGKYLVFTGGRDDIYNIYRIPAEGGKEEQLTFEKTLDDGPEYSPDGKYIYFNSCRSGTMQIWRMDADGSNQVQLTFDKYNDWFPHVSPDNRRIVFLSFPPEVNPADHPYYKRVYIRIMNVGENKPSVVAYLYGGQGTINVPSWSPDSRKVAFISNGIFE
jgi:TolB protein